MPYSNYFIQLTWLICLIFFVVNSYGQDEGYDAKTRGGLNQLFKELYPTPPIPMQTTIQPSHHTQNTSEYCPLTRENFGVNSLNDIIKDIDLNNNDCRTYLKPNYLTCSEAGYKARSWIDIEKIICLYRDAKIKYKEFCDIVHKDYLRYIKNAAASLGLDPKAYACTVLIESAMTRKSVSSKSAKGLGQFTKPGAQEVELVLKANPAYQKAWDLYQQSLNRDKDWQLVTEPNIRDTKHMNTTDIQIFAIGVFLRERMQGLEAMYYQHIINNQDMPALFNTRIVGYNWRPAKVTAYSNAVLSNTTYKIPIETKNYIQKFNQCMNADTNILEYGKAGKTSIKRCKKEKAASQIPQNTNCQFQYPSNRRKKECQPNNPDFRVCL